MGVVGVRVEEGPLAQLRAGGLFREGSLVEMAPELSPER